MSTPRPRLASTTESTPPPAAKKKRPPTRRKTATPSVAHRTRPNYRPASRGLGRVLAQRQPHARGFGFAAASPAHAAGDGFVRARPGAHGVVFASTGSGKLVNVSVPLILDHCGPLVQFDPKREATPITQRERARHGPVFTMDPFNIGLTGQTHALNPMDLLRLPGVDPSAQARSLADDLGAAHRESRDPYWPKAACDLIAAVIEYADSLDDPNQRTLGTVAELLLDSQVYDNLAVLAALDSDIPPNARRGLSNFLTIPDGNNGSTRSCILHFARTFISFLAPAQIAASVGPAPDLTRLLLNGDTAFTLNIVFPTEKARSDASLLNLYLTTLTRIISARTTIPCATTLILIDEAGNLPECAKLLPALHTYGRGKGCELITLWQSLAQMQTVLGTDWRTLIENCGTTQVFGLHPTAVGPLAQLLGVPDETLKDMDDDTMAVLNGSRPVQLLPRVDYRHSPYFTALDPADNPYYTSHPTAATKGR